MDQKYQKTNILPSDIAKYFLVQAIRDGELISPLKMQKLVYYAYVWHLVKTKKKLFNEPIQAWPRGPVVPSLYQELKQYNATPIPEEYLGDQAEIGGIFQKLEGSLDLLKKVYEKYDTLTAFELVVLTHHEKPWLEARKGLKPEEQSDKQIADSDILSFYQSDGLK